MNQKASAKFSCDTSDSHFFCKYKLTISLVLTSNLSLFVYVCLWSKKNLQILSLQRQAILVKMFVVTQADSSDLFWASTLGLLYSTIPLPLDREGTLVMNPYIHLPKCPLKHLTMVPPAVMGSFRSVSWAHVGTCVQVKINVLQYFRIIDIINKSSLCHCNCMFFSPIKRAKLY